MVSHPIEIVKKFSGDVVLSKLLYTVSGGKMEAK